MQTMSPQLLPAGAAGASQPRPRAKPSGAEKAAR